MFASGGGHLDCIKYLVGKGGADVNAADEGGCTAVMLASGGGHLDCIKYLMQSRCPPPEANITAVQPPSSAAFTSAPPLPTKYLMQSRCPPPEANITAVQPPSSAAFTSAPPLPTKYLMQSRCPP